MEAWQLGMQLVEAVYALARQLPREELYGLSAQLRRAAIAIPSSVAEGQQHGFGKNYLRYLAMALGSEAEVQTQLELVVRLKFAPEDRVRPVLDLASRTGQVLRGLKRSVRRRILRNAPGP
ncbi:MAG: four helix bundle protein [Vicinamibacterales bacterium]